MNLSLNALLAQVNRPPRSTQQHQQQPLQSQPSGNIYDTVHMTQPAAHRALLRLPLAALLLQSRVASASPASLSLLSSLLARLLDVLSQIAATSGPEGVAWASLTLSRTYLTAGPVLGKANGCNELYSYMQAAIASQPRGPAGLTHVAGEDVMRAVGLVPGDYRLVHADGRMDESVAKMMMAQGGV